MIKLIALFEPFILENDHVFEAANVERLSESLPAEERADFGYDARSLDWWDYWINVHIPGAAKVVLSSDRRSTAGAPPRRNVPLVAAQSESAAHGAEQIRLRPRTSRTPWQFS